MIKILLAICFIFTNLYGNETGSKIKRSLSREREPQNNETEIFFLEDQNDPILNFLHLGEHCLIAKCPDRLIEIEDGTTFGVSHGWKEFKTWNVGDLIVLYPCHARCFDAPQFFMMNKENKSYVGVTIWSSPKTQNPRAFYLDTIDIEKEEMVLSTEKGEKMRWKIDWNDFQTMDDWKVGDKIVIGKNKVGSTKYFPHHPYILINYPAVEGTGYIKGTPIHEPFSF